MKDQPGIPDPASRRVRVLPDHVARRIAAGEVIDRPHALVRELMDNALDSGADEVTVHLAGGGIGEVRVSDNGAGMTKDDLEACWLPHATSKIAAVEDLDTVRTLGFRGEALSSMASCARLTITTCPAGDEAWRLEVHGGRLFGVSAHHGSPGTTVSVKDLFFNIPARRRFLKSVRSESTLCRRMFLEKAAAHPDVAFRFFSDGELKTFLPPGNRRERVLAAWPELAPPQALLESGSEAAGMSLAAVHARPEFSRRDRQYIRIYANRRRIDDFSLVQAVTWAHDEWMPGGAFPIAFIFLEIDPSQVDFNIHPAKKEARFRDPQAVRELVVRTLRERLNTESYRTAAATGPAANREHSLFEDRNADSPAARTGETPIRPAGIAADISGGSHRESGDYSYGAGFASRPTGSEAADFAQAAGRPGRDGIRGGSGRNVPVRTDPDAPFRYLGQVMGVFLLAECGESLYVVDQHAAHERILFDRFRSSAGPSERLLIPRVLHPEREALMRLELRVERLAAMGIRVEKEGGEWRLAALPVSARALENEIADFLERGEGEAEDLEKDLWADLACKAAVKDSNVLDDAGARRLLGEAFALETPRCPHGRPIWFQVSRDELFELVGRTV